MIRQRIVSLISMRSPSAQSIAIAVLMALSVLFFYDPLSGIGITSWDRSFCEASLAGIDPARRVSNFYKLYLVYFPLLCVAFSVIVSLLLKERRVLHLGVSWVVSFWLCWRHIRYARELRYATLWQMPLPLAVLCGCGFWWCSRFVGRILQDAQGRGRFGRVFRRKFLLVGLGRFALSQPLGESLRLQLSIRNL